MTKEQRAFRKAMQIGTTWIRTNHVNPRASTPVKVTVVMRESWGVTFSNSGELQWPDRVGYDVKFEDASWKISSPSHLIISYSKH